MATRARSRCGHRGGSGSARPDERECSHSQGTAPLRQPQPHLPFPKALIRSIAWGLRPRLLATHRRGSGVNPPVTGSRRTAWTSRTRRIREHPEVNDGHPRNTASVGRTAPGRAQGEVGTVAGRGGREEDSGPDLSAIHATRPDAAQLGPSLEPADAGFETVSPACTCAPSLASTG